MGTSKSAFPLICDVTGGSDEEFIANVSSISGTIPLMVKFVRPLNFYLPAYNSLQQFDGFQDALSTLLNCKCLGCRPRIDLGGVPDFFRDRSIRGGKLRDAGREGVVRQSWIPGELDGLISVA
jgi:hypothetical protein